MNDAPTRARILVVDDEPAIREYETALLSELGHEVLMAVDGAEALELARAQQPHLVLLDIMMPELSGHRGMPAVARGPAHAGHPRDRGVGGGRQAGVGRKHYRRRGRFSREADPRAGVDGAGALDFASAQHTGRRGTARSLREKPAGHAPPGAGGKLGCHGDEPVPAPETSGDECRRR